MTLLQQRKFIGSCEESSFHRFKRDEIQIKAGTELAFDPDTLLIRGNHPDLPLTLFLREALFALHTVI